MAGNTWTLVNITGVINAFQQQGSKKDYKNKLISCYSFTDCSEVWAVGSEDKYGVVATVGGPENVNIETSDGTKHRIYIQWNFGI